jgi:GntR family transcriptional regulator/MocR family aminotransferase
LHLCLHLPDALDDKALAQHLGNLGLTVRPLSSYCLQQTRLRGLIIGYGYAPLAEIEYFGPLLARTISSALKRLGC